MKTRSEAKRERQKKKPERAVEVEIPSCDVCGDAMYDEGDGWKCHTGPHDEKTKEIAKVSDELNAALGRPPRVPKNPFQWPSAHRRAEETEVRDDLRKVVESIFLDDIHGTWKELEKALQLGDNRSEHAYVVMALDKAPARADRAHRLYLTAKLARDKWEAENEAVWGAMWTAATNALQSEKDAGTRSKQITDADVKARVGVMFPDEYRAQTERRRAIELTVRALERLAEIWLKRTGNIDALAARLRG